MQAYGTTFEFSEVPANHLNTNGARGDYKDAVAEYTAGKRGARLFLTLINNWTVHAHTWKSTLVAYVAFVEIHPTTRTLSHTIDPGAHMRTLFRDIKAVVLMHI